MSILSFNFLVFVTALLPVYYVAPVRGRWIVLLIASLVFYAASGWQGLCYLLAVALLTWAGAICVDRLRGQEKAASAREDRAAAHKIQKRRKAVIALILLLCLGALVFIKYFDALRSGANSVFAALSWNVQLPALNLLVPLGLSYFTFQSVGYLIDVSRGKAQVERNPLKYLLFVSFFPQMAQGPISPYGQLAPQFEKPKRFEPETFVSGFMLALWGYFKKMVLADRLAPVTANIAEGVNQPGWIILAGVILYAIRLYADFSGGMDVIRGVARMLGVDMVENFKRPFFSTSVAEYWRRWHISLGTWFRSYLFYPLTISRFGLALSRRGQKIFGKKAGRNLSGAVGTLIIFLLIGIWHTANWNAVIYGAYFGLIMGVSMMLEPLFRMLKKKLRIREKGVLWRVCCMLRTWLLVIFAQYFAFTAGAGKAFSLISETFRNWNLAAGGAALAQLMTPLEWIIAGSALAILIVVDVLSERGVDLNARLSRGCFLWRWLAMLFLILCVLIFGCYGEGFDAAAFLYTQF